MEEREVYDVMVRNDKTKVFFFINCDKELLQRETIKQVELYKCFGRDWHVVTGDVEEKIIKELKREKRQMKANGQLKEWEDKKKWNC